MATYSWSIPEGKKITGTTFIKTTDDHIADTIDNLVDFVNGEGVHAGQGLTYDLIDRASTQTITGLKTFTSTINANVTGSLAGNATTATTLQTARNINLIGDISGSSSFDGSANININTTLDASSAFSSGMIMMWSGSSANVPSGWYLCDGTNSTPNLIGRFVRGASSSGITGGSADSVVVSHSHSGSTGDTGSHTHTGSTNTTGSHTHGITTKRNTSDGGVGGISYDSLGESTVTPSTNAAGNHSHTVSINSGGSHSHSVTVNASGESGVNKNLPPYYDICFIMKG